MKRKLQILITFGLLILFISIVGIANAAVPIDQEHFPDFFFREELSQFYGYGDTLDDSEIYKFTQLILDSKITDYTGIEYLQSLKIISNNNKSMTLTKLDLSKNLALEEVALNDCNLNSLILGECPNLKRLFLRENNLSSIDVSSCPALLHLDCTSNNLNSLDLKNNPNLMDLYCGNNSITSLDLSNNTKLCRFDCGNNLLQTLDLSKNGELRKIGCSNNQISTIVFPNNNTALRFIFADENNFTSIDITPCTSICAMVKETERKGPAPYGGGFSWWGADDSIGPYLRVGHSVTVIADNYISAPIHYLVKNEKVDSTCTKTGTEAYWSCSVCNILFSDEEGHNEISAPTVIPMKNHILTSHDKINPTCTINGTEAYWECTECHKLFSDGEAANEITSPIAIPAKHNLIIHNKVEPTCTNTGTEEYWECTVCHKLFSDENAKREIFQPIVIYIYAAHTLVKHEKVEPTYTTTGTEEYWECSVCGKLFSDEKGIKEISTPVIIPMLARTQISKTIISKIKDQEYTGKAITPKVTVKYNGKKLIEGTDYTLAYKNNKEIGKATITIKGKGAYTGKGKVTFIINPKIMKLSSLKAGSNQLTVKWKKGKSIDGYEIQYSLKKNFKSVKLIMIFSTKMSSITIFELESGKTYYVRIRSFKEAKGVTYYSEWSKPLKKKVK